MTTPPLGNAEPLYDLTMIQKMSRGNEAFMIRTKQLFIDSVPATVTDLQQSYASADWAAVSAAAHKLKSTIDAIRIESLKTVVRQIESDAKAQTNLQQMQENIDFLADIMEQVVERFREDLTGA
ncbi:Hpt domain-containing protein [Pontibacter beigongshangensis]|uniref:Hpt domain-containing protein n=1 Tax=Pontibacter beigongshangensis TaxID=2574733 RepID=UPI00164F2F06|nr:Hpt domain-containing protein [Pontibacter beigongshangensis]